MIEDGFDSKYGARPIKRIIQKYIEDSIADLMVSKKLSDGCTIILSAETDKTKENPVKAKINKRKS
jgi:ATP-dependent Clp protease ATP-binding subunit ClpC